MSRTAGGGCETSATSSWQILGLATGPPSVTVGGPVGLLWIFKYIFNFEDRSTMIPGQITGQITG